MYAFSIATWVQPYKYMPIVTKAVVPKIFTDAKSVLLAFLFLFL
jgi:hypothetical protein